MITQNPIPNKEMPHLALQAAMDGISQLGFPREGMLQNYEYSFRDQRFRVNSMVFAHSLHRNPAEYASFTVFNPANRLSEYEIVEFLSYTSAPFHLIHREDRFSLWGTKFKENRIEAQPVAADITYENLTNVLAHYSEDFNPKRIIDVKQGRDQFINPIFSGLNTLQLSLWTLDVTADLLEDHFRAAVNILRSYQIPEEMLLDLATQLLGITILRDTRALGHSEFLLRDFISLDQLLDVAVEQFPKYFKADLFRQYDRAAARAYSTLSKISYAAFAPDMLSRLYKTAYSREKRKELGRYDTPLYLTRQIWDNIPVEYLAPNKRITADMTCGWGSFLIAGHDRLSNLSDIEPSKLSHMLFGNDIDTFTSKLAGLALLLYSGTDSWNIDHSDALNWNWLSDTRPNIIVGNPPFSGDRKKGSHRVSKTPKREQEANHYLDYAIDRLTPDGYMAMLMPQSFLAAEASPGLRKKLLENCDLWEIWELPNGVFPGVSQETIVLFAKKRSDAKKLLDLPTRIRNVQKKTLKAFREKSVFSTSVIAPSQNKWDEASRPSEGSTNTHIIDYRLFLNEATWKIIQAENIPLNSIARLIQGTVRGKKLENKRFLNYPNPIKVPWLTGSKKAMPQRFFIDYHAAQVLVYPNDLEEPRYDDRDIFEENKVLLSSLTDPSWGKRIKVAIERNGYYVSDSFWAIAPRPDIQNTHITVEVLAAVIDWKVSNGWIVENQKTKNITKRALASIPFPQNLTDHDAQHITGAVRLLEDPSISLEAKRDAEDRIDQILKRAYKLEDEVYERLDLIEKWDLLPIITIDEVPADHSNWLVNGITEDIFADKNQIKLWLEGFSSSQVVDIVANMPGWMLRPNAAFRTKIPRYSLRNGNLQDVSWGTFLPQTYTYLDEDELFDELSRLQNRQ